MIDFVDAVFGEFEKIADLFDGVLGRHADIDEIWYHLADFVIIDVGRHLFIITFDDENHFAFESLFVKHR